MALINSSSAVIAKARAKYGNRLKEKDYHAMVRTASVGEVVMYLKTYTYFQNFLSQISNTDVHRGNVEQILREEQFSHFLSLCRYNKSASPVTRYILRQKEITEIMEYLTLFAIGRPLEYLFSLPLYFTSHTDIHLDQMTKAVTYDDFLRCLGNTEYKKLLLPFYPKDNSQTNLPAIEDRLELFALKELYDSISKIKNKKEKATLTELFDTMTDLENFSRIIRLKKFYHMNNSEIREHLFPYGSIKGKKLDAVLQKERYEDICSSLSDTKIGKKVRNKSFDLDEEIASNGRFELCRHNLYFSSNPDAVLLSFYILLETELKNVINIIEGVRYSLSPSAIEEILISA